MTKPGSTTVATPIIAEAKQHEPRESNLALLGFKNLGFRALGVFGLKVLEHSGYGVTMGCI